MKWLKRIAVTLLLIVGLALAAAWVQYDRQRRALESVVADAKAAGLPTSYDDLLAAYPPPGDQDNAAIVYMEALQAIRDVEARMPIERVWAFRDLPNDTVLPAELPDWSAAEQALVADALDTYADVLVCLRKASQKPASQFYGRYGETFTYAGFAYEARKLLRWSVLEYIYAIKTGDTARAVDALRTYVPVAAHFAREPHVVLPHSELMKEYFASLEVAERYADTDTELEDLVADAWSVGNDVERLQTWLAFDFVRSTGHWHGYVPHSVVSQWRSVPQVESLYRTAWLAYHTQDIADSAAIWLHTEKRLLGAYGTMERAIEETWPLVFNSLKLVQSPPIVKENEDSLRRTLVAFGYDAAQARLAALRHALRRYYADTGTFPDSVDELVPAYLTAVPLDPFDGNPLRMVKIPDGTACRIYSIGTNRTDDRGELDPKLRSGDIGVEVKP